MIIMYSYISTCTIDLQCIDSSHPHFHLGEAIGIEETGHNQFGKRPLAQRPSIAPQLAVPQLARGPFTVPQRLRIASGQRH